MGINGGHGPPYRDRYIMFHDIDEKIIERMRYLEGLDAEDRGNGTGRMERLRQIPPETGKFIAMQAVSSPLGKWLEIGSSAGYSSLWLSLACRERGTTITTFEVLKEKIKLARETFKTTEVEGLVKLVEGDARELLSDYKDVSFCFLDAEKEVYEECYDKVIVNMVAGGVLIADNATSHKEDLAGFIDKVMADERVDAMVVPVGKGELVCRKKN